VVQYRVPEVKTETRIEAGTNSQQPANWTVRFPKSDHLVSLGSGQKGTLRTITPGMTPAPRWCPPGLTPNQRRRSQRIRAQKMREETTEKERDEHFNTIWLVIPMKQEWRVKEKANTLAFMASNHDMDLLDDDESPLIKDGCLPPTGMDINMVFTLLAEFKVVEEEVA
jgi:hypothetical protein